MRFCPILDRDVTSGEMDMQSCLLGGESPSACSASVKHAGTSIEPGFPWNPSYDGSILQQGEFVRH